MKILIIPDIHGESFWKNYVTFPDKYDKIIFLGDYMDSFFIKDDEMIDNLKEIIEFKKRYPDKVILLWGNHDLAYWDTRFINSGFRMNIFTEVNEIFVSNQDLFKLVYQIDIDNEKFLFSHAGISKSWLDAYIDGENNIQDRINNLNLYDYLTKIALRQSIYSGSTNGESSPIWLRPEEYNSNNVLYGYNQFIGHTPDSKNPYTYTYDNGLSVARITVLDRSRNKAAFEYDLGEIAKSNKNYNNYLLEAA